LESILPKVERKILNQANEFKYSGSNVPSSHSEAQDIITKYFWNLFCPFYSIEEHWEANKDNVWGAASSYLRSYGNSLNALSIACNSVEGGLRSVLDELTKAYLNEQSKNRIGSIVSQYYEDSTPEEMVSDSADFVREYKDVLPPEKVKDGGAYIRVHFLEVMKELPFVLKRARVR
jgi:hypothetical protein